VKRRCVFVFARVVLLQILVLEFKSHLLFEVNTNVFVLNNGLLIL